METNISLWKRSKVVMFIYRILDLVVLFIFCRVFFFVLNTGYSLGNQETSYLVPD